MIMETNEILKEIGDRYSKDFADVLSEEIGILTSQAASWKTTANDWKRTADAEKQKIAAIVSLINAYEEFPIAPTSDEAIRLRELKIELNTLVGL